MDTIRVSKTINAPLPYVFKWCTDFRENDPKITGSSSQRKILEKTKKRVIFVSSYKDEKGEPRVGVNIVSLKQPNYWHLDYFGEEDNETGEYKLKTLAKNKTKLDMVFKEKWKIANPPSKESQVNSTSAVWDKYVAAIEKEYNSR